MRRELAETIALQAFAWLVSNDELLPVFLGATGAAESDLKARAEDAEFLASVLDFLMMDDEWVTAFCDSMGIGYEEPLAARRELPGGDLPEWT